MSTATTRTTAHDLWPLALMRSRSGTRLPSVDVARPTSFEEVATLLRSGGRVVAMGGGSGVCGALAPEEGDLVLDLGGLDNVEIDAENLIVRAGAGVNGLALERRLNEAGLTLGHYPSSLPVATVGGLVSTRSSGQESSRYGSIEDMALGLTVALADGRILEARVQPRSAAGPALHQLFVGAEGALGLVLEAALRVHRLPEAVVGRGWRLPAVRPGLAAVREVMQRHLRPLVLRLYDPEDSALQGFGDGCLLVAAAAGPKQLADAEASLLAEVIESSGGDPLGEGPWAHWVAHRFDLSADRLRDFLEPPASYLDTIELAGTWTVLPALYDEVKSHLRATASLALCHFSHGYPQGCCAYFTFAGSAPDEAAAEAVYLEAWRGAMEIALRRGATITHHHGVGQARAPWARQELGGWWEVWRRVRQGLDPHDKLNPNAMGGRDAR
jgi:alkyldihydroxyacetonephosphate synthase